MERNRITERYNNGHKAGRAGMAASRRTLKGKHELSRKPLDARKSATAQRFAMLSPLCRLRPAGIRA